MTTNTKWPEVATYQNNAEIAINNQRGRLDAAISELYTLVGDDSPTLTVREFTQILAIGTDAAQTAAQVITVPSTVKKVFVVHNSSSYDLTIQEGTNSYVIPTGDRATFYAPGTANTLQKLFSVTTAGLTITARPSFQLADTTKTVYLRVMDKEQTLLSIANGLEAYMVCGTAPDGNTDFDLRKNGVQVGTVQILSGATTGTFTVGSDVSFTAGDRFSVVVTTANSVGKNYAMSIKLT